MAIALDTATNGNTAEPGTSVTYSHTCSGSNRILIVSVFTVGSSGGDVVSGITYNSVAMTRINTVQGTGDTDRRAYLYYLVNPSTGANNVVVSTSASVNIYSSCASYTGAKQTGQPDSNNTGTATGGATSLSVSTTTVADNCWLVGFAYCNQTLGAGSNTTLRAHPGIQASMQFIDSNSAQTPAGSKSMAITITPGGNGVMAIASIAPLVGYTLTMDQGSYTLTGQTLNLLRALRLILDQGSYTLTGQAANVLYGRVLSMVYGAYTLTGQVVNLVFRGWTRPTKNSNSWTFGTKNSNTWTNSTKNSNSWTFHDKNT